MSFLETTEFEVRTIQFEAGTFIDITQPNMEVNAQILLPHLSSLLSRVSEYRDMLQVPHFSLHVSIS
jgi:hypothetical protein